VALIALPCLACSGKPGRARRRQEHRRRSGPRSCRRCRPERRPRQPRRVVCRRRTTPSLRRPESRKWGRVCSRASLVRCLHREYRPACVRYRKDAREDSRGERTISARGKERGAALRRFVVFYRQFTLLIAVPVRRPAPPDAPPAGHRAVLLRALLTPRGQAGAPCRRGEGQQS
jgi:hypothetical protein